MTSPIINTQPRTRTFREKKRLVQSGIVGTIAVVVACFSVAAQWSVQRYGDDNYTYDESDAAATRHRTHSDSCLELTLLSLLGPALCLGVQILIAAVHRLHSPEDIDGSAINKQDTDTFRHKQANLQNTLEQTCYAALVYLISSVVLRRYRLMIPTASCMFVLGRFLFYRGLSDGINYSRIIGFALTFLPTNILLLTNVAVLLADIVL
mmetsp:Transcript_22833/g.47440  ORF Transcript_22833/g.47440 Transcript_22833/m.47440 type:complete len:208 (+) Transcript_22833:166-789(+)